MNRVRYSREGPAGPVYRAQQYRKGQPLPQNTVAIIDHEAAIGPGEEYPEVVQLSSGEPAVELSDGDWVLVRESDGAIIVVDDDDYFNDYVSLVLS